MAEYIEREAAIAAMQNTEHDLMADYGPEYGSEWGISTEKAVETIKSVPAADVAPVIRCRDCENTTTYKNRLMCYIWEQQVEENDFCSRGERKRG